MSVPVSTPASSRVALVGFGTVGQSVAKILCARPSPLLQLTHVCNRNVERKKVDWIGPGVRWTDRIEDVLSSDTDMRVKRSVLCRQVSGILGGQEGLLRSEDRAPGTLFREDRQ